jgi:hypothetical protein
MTGRQRQREREMHDDTHQTVEKEEVREEVHLFKVHCMHIWNYHNKIPFYY